MNKKRKQGRVSRVLLAKKVREFAGLNAWEMYKRMGKKSVQAYLSLERKAQRISLADLVALRAIYIDNGGNIKAFDELLVECAGKK